MENVIKDVRYALRMMGKNPTFTAIVVLTLALGIGANTAIFSVVNGVLLRPLAYNDPDNLVYGWMSYPDFLDVSENTQTLDRVSVSVTNRYTLTSDGAPEQIAAVMASDDFFATMTSPLIGRFPTAPDDPANLTVISYDFWRRLGGDASVLQKRLTLNGETFGIVGVMPPEFNFPTSEYKLYMPLDAYVREHPEAVEYQNRTLRIFRVVGHLRSGVSLEQANAEMATLSQRLEQQFPDTNTDFTISFVRLYDVLVGDVRPALLVLLGTVGLVLLIACANVANLLLANTRRRQHEIAIRSALGAGRGRLARQLVTESLLLSAAGGTLGVLLASWSISGLRIVNPGNIPRIELVTLDWRVLAFACAISVLTGLLFGVIPAWQASREGSFSIVKEGGRSGKQHAGGRLRSALVVGEIALALVIVISAGLMLKSFKQLIEVDPGFEPERLSASSVALSHLEVEARAAAVDRIFHEVRELPGVEAVAGSSGLPPVSAQRGTYFETAATPLEEPPFAYFLSVTPEFIRALGTPLRSGRWFAESDMAEAAPVVVISESLAARYFEGRNPVGLQLKIVNPQQSAEWRTIVGVVGDIYYSGLADPDNPTIYTPYKQNPQLMAGINLLVRSRQDEQSQAAIQRAVSAAGAGLYAVNFRTGTDLISTSIAQPRFNSLLISLFAGLGLVLALVGIYGVLAYTVQQRTYEIGVRMAFGARAEDVLRMVLGHGLKLALLGIGLGLAGAYATTRLLSSLLFNVTPTDPVTFVTIALLILFAAFCACYAPARRATRVDPMVALRHE